MPEAEKFTTFGRGNGFPFCTDRVDVDDAFRFLTLGGYSGEGTPDIELSRRNAMKLYWNLYSLNGTASASAFTASATVSDVILQVGSGGTDYDPSDEAKTPVSRVCTGLGGTRNGKDASEFLIDVGADIEIGDFGIRRMFQGGEFIGFGIHSRVSRYKYFANSSSSVSDAGSNVFISSAVTWRSIVEEEPSIGDDPTPAADIDFNISELDISGVHFLSLSVAQVSGNDPATLSVSTNTASASTDDFETSASLSTMNFWTY